MNSLALHLALRYIRKRRIAWLAVVTCILSVAIPVCVISVIQGFVDVGKKQLHGAESDLVAKVYDDYALPYHTEQIDRLQQHPQVINAAPFVKSYAVVTPVSFQYGDRSKRKNELDVIRYNTGCQIEGVNWDQEQVIKRLHTGLLHKRPGLDLSAPDLEVHERGSGFLTPSWRANIALQSHNTLLGLGGGFMPIPRQATPVGLILGHELIYTNGLFRFAPGKHITLTIPNNKGGVLAKVFGEISDTIGTGYLEFDKTMVVLPLGHAQRLTDMDRNPSEITGYRIQTTKEADLEQVRKALLHDDTYRLWNQRYTVLTWQETGSINMVKTFEVQRNVMILVMILVQAQCIFIVYAVFSTLVSEKRHDIGILLGIGASRSSIMFTFIYASLIASFIGGILGWLLGWGFLSILNPVSDYFDIALFPQDVLYTPEAPISWDISIPLLFMAIMLCIGLVSVLIPAYRASRIMPLESIREGQA